MNQTKNTSSHKHHYIISAYVVFHPNGNEEQMGNVMVNAMVRLDNMQFSERALAKAQTAAQMNFHQTVPAEKPDVPHVVIGVTLMAISYLGFMSNEEFYAVPEGVKKSQVL